LLAAWESNNGTLAPSIFDISKRCLVRDARAAGGGRRAAGRLA